MKYETKRTLTKYLIGFIVVLVVLLLSAYYLSISYNLDYNISFLIVLSAFAVILFVILYALYGPRQPRTRYRDEYYNDNRRDVYHHYNGERRAPRDDNPYYLTNKQMGKKAEKFSEHQWDPVDHWGFFGKKRKRR